MSDTVSSPLPQFFDRAGKPLTGGSIYVGTANQNPETNPITVYWDAALTQPAAQPLQTSGGYIVRSGTPSAVYASSEYSMTVKTSTGELVFYAPISNIYVTAAQLIDVLGANLVGFDYLETYDPGTIGKWLQDLATPDGAAFIGFDSTGTGLAASTAQAALVELDNRKVVSSNIFPNARWYVMTAHAAATKYDASGVAMTAVNVSSYTTGANTVVCNTANTANLAVNRLVSFSAAADANLKITAARVLSIVTNTSFTIRLPNGLTAAASAACTATPVNAGASASTGSGLGFDGWAKSTTLECWRDDWSTNLKAGAEYAAGLKKGSAAAEIYYVAVDSRDLESILGKTITVGGWVKNPPGASWRVFSADSVNGFVYGDTVTDSGYSWSEQAFNIPSNATNVSIGFELIGSSGDCFYLSQPVAGVGNYIGEPPVDFRREYIIPVVKFSPQSYTNANITFPAGADAIGTYSFVFDAYAETNGCIAPEARALDILLEGFNAAAVILGAGGSYFATRDELNVPHKYGPIMFQQVASVKNSCGGLFTLGDDATGYIYGLASANWANVSMDINGVWV